MERECVTKRPTQNYEFSIKQLPRFKIVTSLKTKMIFFDFNLNICQKLYKIYNKKRTETLST